MRWIAIFAALAGPALAAPLPAKRLPPLPVPAVFVTQAHGLTFRTPQTATYCPLPSDWVGSDHGTFMFLRPPHACHGAGFPSTARGAEPDGLPTIDIFYSYWDEDMQAPKCRADGQATLFHRPVRLCRSTNHGMVSLGATARYEADAPSEVTITLTARPDEIGRYVETFKTMTASLRTCSATWRDNNRKTFTVGTGAPCPKDGKFF